MPTPIDEMQPVGGFMAIQPPAITKPMAFRKLVHGPDGVVQVVLVDETGQVILDPSGYQVVEQNTYYEPGTTGATPAPGTATPPNGQPVGNVSAAQQVVQETVGRGADRDGSSDPGSGNFGRSQANNFGYVNKPGFMGVAGMLPGPVGMVGKAANLGINANNAASVNTARKSMGLEGIGIGGGIRDTLRDNKGFVADVSIGGSQYATPVGLEALSKSGQTTMTPQEASLRQAAATRAGQPAIAEATQAQIDARNSAFKEDYGTPGLFGGIKDSVSGFLDDMFSSPVERANKALASQTRRENSGSNFSPSRSGFADMIGANSGKQATSTPSNPVSGAARSTAGKVTSQSNNNVGRGSDRGGGSSGSRSNPGTSGHMGAGGGTTSGHGPGIGSA